VDRQPPLGVIGAVLVFLAGLKGVFDRCLSPDLARGEVDAAAGVEWVAFEDAGQLLEVDGQVPQYWRCAVAELVGQVSIPVPASLPESNHELASQLGGPVHALHDRRDDAVASQLQRLIIGADATEQVDDSWSVTTIYRRPQGGALLL